MKNEWPEYLAYAAIITYVGLHVMFIYMALP